MSFKLNILLNHAKYPQKTSAMLHITLFYIFQIFTFNGLANLFREDDFSSRKKLFHIKNQAFKALTNSSFYK